MAAPAPASNAITIDVLNDLKDGAHLKALLQNNQSAIFAIASEISQFSEKPIKSVVGSNPAQITLQAAATWKTTTGISFALTPSATCSVAIGNTSAKFAVAKSIDSTDTQNIVSGPLANQVFVNI